MSLDLEKPNYLEYMEIFVKLACKRTVSLDIPSTIDSMILKDKRLFLSEQKKLFIYFIKEKYPNVKLKDIKFKKYVCFLREERAKFFPNYKTRISSKKFIANKEFRRGSTMLDYYEKYLIGDYNGY